MAKTQEYVGAINKVIFNYTGSPGETRNSSGDEIANVNLITDDIVQALQNTIDSYINSATDLRGCVGTQVYQSQ